jgi:hypothetical protein
MGCTETLATPKMQKGDDGSVDIGAAILFKLGHSVKCLFSIQNYRVKATFYRVSLAERKLGYSHPERLYTSSSTSRDAARDGVGVSLALCSLAAIRRPYFAADGSLPETTVKGSDDLGTVAEFTSRLKKGYD